MARQFTGSKIILATHNAGKLAEFRDLLPPHITWVTAGELRLPAPDETGTSFIENATIKALAAMRATNEVALADDSGLAVDALSGAPGVYTADWAGDDRNYQTAFDRIEREMGNNPNHRARFICHITLAFPDGHLEHAEAACEGQVTFPPRGTGGFGYHPIFIPDGDTRTFGEMRPEEVHFYNHRAKAIAMIRQACFNA